MNNDLKSFLIFKLQQHSNITGITYGGDKEKAAKILKDNIKQWISEAIAAGVKS